MEKKIYLTFGRERNLSRAAFDNELFNGGLSDAKEFTLEDAKKEFLKKGYTSFNADSFLDGLIKTPDCFKDWTCW